MAALNKLNIIFGNRGNEDDRAANQKCWSCNGFFNSIVKVALVVGVISLVFTCFEAIGTISLMVMTNSQEPSRKKVLIISSFVLIVEFMRVVSLIYWIKNSKEGYSKASSATKICVIFTTLALILIPAAAKFINISLEPTIFIFLIPFLLDIIFSTCYAFCVAQHFLYNTSREEAQVSLNDWADRDKQKYRRKETEADVINLDSESGDC